VTYRDKVVEIRRRSIPPSHRLSLAALVILARAAALQGQTLPPADELISTDRPSIANSSVVVPMGSFQAENGFQVTNRQGQTSFDGPETSLRFGVLEKTEFRLAVPNYFGNVHLSQEATTSGFGDLTIGLKRQLGPAKQFDLSGSYS
jgi:hypothetical protein